MELFKMMTGTNMVHVPYQGGAPGLERVLPEYTEHALESQALMISDLHGTVMNG
jgi:hypothetical protein